jgi:hypothetical protein
MGLKFWISNCFGYLKKLKTTQGAGILVKMFKVTFKDVQ